MAPDREPTPQRPSSRPDDSDVEVAVDDRQGSVHVALSEFLEADDVLDVVLAEGRSKRQSVASKDGQWTEDSRAADELRD